PTIWPETVQCAQYRLQHQTYSLPTKWVCAKTQDVDAHLICCRLQHHRPTSHEVGMRENLTCTSSCKAPESYTASATSCSAASVDGGSLAGRDPSIHWSYHRLRFNKLHRKNEKSTRPRRCCWRMLL